MTAGEAIATCAATPRRDMNDLLRHAVDHEERFHITRFAI
jgi:hypothetical protein